MQIHPAAALLVAALHHAAHGPDVPLPGFPVRQGLDQPTHWGGESQPPVQPQPERKPGDKEIVEHLTGHLTAGLQAATDPQLRAHLSTALAALHKHAATLAKEHEQALGGKMSPRLMASAQGR